jgi:AbrB family looped-hinge helix DNA binding protein
MPKINQHGQVTIPIWMRRKLEIESGEYVDIEEGKGCVVIKPRRGKLKHISPYKKK